MKAEGSEQQQDKCEDGHGSLGHGWMGMVLGWWLDSRILEALSKQNNSMILQMWFQI